MVPSFTSWLETQTQIRPQSDRIIPLIAQAGATGMNRGQIGSVIDLDRDTLDQVLAGLVGFGQLTLTFENGLRVYRATSFANQPLR